MATLLETWRNLAYGDGLDEMCIRDRCKDDRGYDWWTTDGELVLEDPDYCASVSFTVGSWIELLTKYSDSAK